jgi:glycine betaine/choline ABC-type transport system substrate-binding protein
MSKFSKWGLYILAAVMLMMPGLVSLSEACVGRELHIGYLEKNTEQAVMAQLLAILIAERTNAKVILEKVEDSQEALDKLESDDIQLYIEYTGIGLLDILGEEPETDPKKVYKKVRQAYMKHYNLIWLKTFGFNSINWKVEEKKENNLPLDLPLYAAPVVRKETLEKWPLLVGLLNQLHRKIDNKSIKEMVAMVDQEGKNPREVASDFLKTINKSIKFALVGQS